MKGITQSLLHNKFTQPLIKDERSTFFGHINAQHQELQELQSTYNELKHKILS